MANKIHAGHSIDIKGVWDTFIEEGFRFPLYVLSRPFKAFGDIKLEGRGSVKSCIIFLVLMCILNILQVSYSGYVVNYNMVYFFNIFTSILGTLAQVLLLCIANWSVTVLINGSGSFKEIFMVNMYAMYPMLYLNSIYIILTNVLTLDEMAIAYFFVSLAGIMYFLYVFIGLIVVHEFTFTRAVASILLTIFSLLIILFIALLIATMANELIRFVQVVYKEIILHYT